MSKASQLLRGYLQIKTVPLPMAGAPGKSLFDGPDPDVEAGNVAVPAPVEVGLKPLTPGEEADILANALAYARAHGIEKPSEEDEIVAFGQALHRCLIGVVDKDSDPKHPEPFFDGGLKQLEEMPEIGRDGVNVLAEMHRTYQDEIGGLIADLGENGILAAAKELAGPHGAPFWYALRPGLQLSYVLFSARLLLSLLQDRSSSGSDSESNGNDSRDSTPRITPSSTTTSDVAPKKRAKRKATKKRGRR